MKSLYSMFLSQAYQDCWDDYNRSVKLKNFPRWDYVILTASNDQQAEGFRRQIEERKEYLPAGTRFAAIPDRGGERVGSGGATLEVLKYLHEQEGDFRKLRVLVIHCFVNLLIQFFAVNYQHQFRIQISTSHIQIIGTYY